MIGIYRVIVRGLEGLDVVIKNLRVVLEDFVFRRFFRGYGYLDCVLYEWII